MEKSAKSFEKLMYILTVVSFLTACILAIVVLWKQGSYDTPLSISFFISPIFWVIATAVTIWYIYEFGFPRAKSRKADGTEKGTLSTLSMFVPFFVGFIVGLAAYYLLYWLSVAFMASIGYILIVVIVVVAVLTIIFLTKLFFKPKENLHNRWLFLTLSVVGSIVLLALAILWIVNTMKVAA